MKTIKLLLHIIILSGTVFCKAQSVSKTGPEIDLKEKYPSMKYLGADAQGFYAYNMVVKPDRIHLNLFKGNISDFSVTTNKEIDLEDFRPYVFNNSKGNCRVYLYYKSNRIYIYYSLLDTKGDNSDYRIYMKVLDQDFNPVSQEQLGTIEDTGSGFLGAFEVIHSPDGKIAMVSLKNFCEKKKAFVMNTEVYERTELIWIDTETGKKIYTRILPIENESSRLKTYDYIMNNNGDIVYMMMYFDRFKRYETQGVFVCISKFKQESILTHEVKLNEMDSSIVSGISQCRNGDVIYAGVTKQRYMYKYIDLAASKVAVDESYDLRKSGMTSEMSLDKVIETDAGTYLMFGGGYVNYGGYFIAKPLEFVKIEKNGSPVWHRTISNWYLGGMYYNRWLERDYRNYKLIQDGRKLYVFMLENKESPAEPQKDGYKALKPVPNNPITNSQMVRYSIDENGKIGRTVVVENEKSLGVMPCNYDPVLPGGELLMHYCNPKYIKFVSIKTN